MTVTTEQAVDALDEMSAAPHGTDRASGDPCECDHCGLAWEARRLLVQDVPDEQLPWAAFWFGLARIGYAIDECDRYGYSRWHYRKIYGGA